MITIDGYQIAAGSTAIYPGSGEILGLAYTALGLGEVGELQGKVKKILRDNNGVITQDKKRELAAELGDVLWYVAATATELGYFLSEIAEMNLEKLADRAERGKLQGSGDNR